MKDFMNPSNGWKKYTDITISLSVNEFYNEFCADKASFGFDKAQETTECWDIKCSPWKKNVKIIDLICPVKGVPFIT